VRSLSGAGRLPDISRLDTYGFKRLACQYPQRFIVPLALVLTLGCGILDEFHQATIPGRYGSLTDIALNILGALLVIALIRHEVILLGQ
jgi:VanZ family protein